ncbi:type IV pilin N-terminal domain-containing protein [Methanospirillum sp.]|uniref:type IV pilin N-terminal domain-containing protein n=1 Tax=Methanospirillum sp. TaxID=45200 RepID=UPI002C36B397|nr:type IV pilin N-terminal domain-containing protein [Methanospirillum sp.]HPP78869.1 type IV pilin N-terminal domain-containing protein [Methanospirillum sp.]
MYKRDDAVSPVIGVILMVAITVILAAVIAAFVFGMAGNVDKSKTTTVTVERVNATHLKLTHFGGAGAKELAYQYPFNVTVGDTEINAGSGLTKEVGSVAYYNIGSSYPPGTADVTIVGNFNTGKFPVYSSKI